MQRCPVAADCDAQSAVHDDGVGVVASTVAADCCAADFLSQFCGGTGANPDAHLGHSCSFGAFRPLQSSKVSSSIEAEIAFFGASKSCGSPKGFYIFCCGMERYNLTNEIDYIFLVKYILIIEV